MITPAMDKPIYLNAKLQLMAGAEIGMYKVSTAEKTVSIVPVKPGK
jgi:hypothetical protein